MKYNVLQFITNDKGQYSATISATCDDLKTARFNFLSAARTLVNASDVEYAVVKIEDEYGNETSWREVIDNRPEPIPEEPTESA